MEDRKNNQDQANKSEGVSRRTFFWGLLAYRRNKHGEVVVRPVWKRVGIVFGSAFLLLLTAAYVGLFVFFRYVRGWDVVEFSDIHKLVTDQAAFREKVGNEQYRQAKQYLEEGKIREAIMYAYQANVRAPANRDARILYAQIQVWMNRPDRAISLLFDGLEYGNYDNEYIQLLLQMMTRYEDDEGIIRLYEYMKERKAELKDPEMLLYLEVAAANAHFNQGEFDETLKMVEKMDPRLLIQSQVLRARIEWERGMREQALQRLEALRQHPASRGQVVNLLVNYYRQMGNLQQARSLGLTRVMEAPDDNTARVDYLLTLHELGEKESEKRQLDTMMRKEPDEELRNLLMMYAIRTRNFELGKYVHDLNVRDNMSVVESGLRMAELYIMRGEYQQALDLLENLEGQQGELAERSQHFFHALKGIIYHGLGQRDLREQFLNRFLESRTLRPEHFMAITNRLIEINADASARRLLEHALTRMFPHNRELLTQQLRLRLKRPDENLITTLEELLQLRRVSRELVEQSYQELVKDRFLFTPGRDKLLKQLEEVLENYRSEV